MPTAAIALSAALFACAGTRAASRVEQADTPVAITATTATTTTARSPLSRPLQPGRLSQRAPRNAPLLAPTWTTTTAIRAAPVWSGERMVAVSTGGALHGLAAQGRAPWTLQLQAHVIGLSSDGAGGLRVTTRDGRVIAVNDRGQRQWEASLGARSNAGAIFGPGGRTYALADGLHALDADGRLLWHLPRVGARSAGPVVIGELVVFGTEHGELIAVDPDGTIRWELNVGSSVENPPCAGPQGDILVGTDLGELRSISTDGALRWTAKLEGRVSATATAGPHGRIAVVGGDHTLYYLDRDGNLLWRFVAGGGLSARPTIDAAGAVLLAGRDNNLYLIDDSGQARWRTNVGHPIGTPVVAAPDGSLHLGTDGAQLLSLLERKSK